MNNKLFILRRNRGLSQLQLARMCGFTQQFIQRIEKGKVEPSIRSAMKIAEALGVTVDELVREEVEHAS